MDPITDPVGEQRDYKIKFKDEYVLVTCSRETASRPSGWTIRGNQEEEGAKGATAGRLCGGGAPAGYQRLDPTSVMSCLGLWSRRGSETGSTPRDGRSLGKWTSLFVL